VSKDAVEGLQPLEHPPTREWRPFSTLQRPKKNGRELFKAKSWRFIHDPGRGSPLASIKLETGETYYSVVPEGVYEGQPTQIGGKASVEIGNVLPLGKIPEGTMVCNIELSHGDGGKLVRSSGSYSTVVAHTPDGTS